MEVKIMLLCANRKKVMADPASSFISVIVF